MTLVKKVLVQQEETQKGVVARINKITADDKRLYFSLTDAQGTATPNQPCIASDRFEAEPTLPVYLKVEPKACGEELKFIVSSVRATYALALLGDDAAKAGDFAKAQLYYNNAAARLKATSISESLILSNQAKIAAGKSLGVAMPTVNVNGEEIFTTEALSKLRAFQSSEKLDTSGNLDASTVEALGGGIRQDDIFRRALSVPSTRLDAYKINPADIRGSHLPLETTATATSHEGRYDLKAMINVEKGREAKAAGMKAAKTREGSS